MFRSLNNLLEKFHHAYWFYYMPSATSFIPISKYAGPISIIISCFLFIGLDLWWTSGEIPLKSIKQTRTPWKFLQRSIGTSSFSNKQRPIYIPIILLCSSFVYPMYIFKYIENITEMIKMDLLHALYIFISIMIGQQTTSWFMIPLIQRILAGDAGSSRSTISGVWMIFKSLIAALYGIFLFSLLTMNPSLSLLTSIPTLLFLLILKPTRSFLFMMIQSIILQCTSPPMLLFGYGLFTSMKTSIDFLSFIVDSWFHFTGLFLPIMILIYWPLNLACQVLVTMEP